MKELHRTLPIHDFKIPANVIQTEFCADENCSQKIKEWMPREKSPPIVEKNEPERRLKIIKPFNEDEFEFQQGISPDVQQIRLEAERAFGVGDVTWTVDNGQVGNGDSVFWQIDEGRHQIRAKASTGEEDSIEITVISSLQKSNQ